MAAFIGDVLGGRVNLSILSLPSTLLLAALPHWYTIYKAESNKVQGGWSNENPRAFVARLNARAAAGKKLSELEEMILRGQSAQQNAFEWWAMWAVAVLFGRLANIPLEQMNYYTIVHVATRIVYSYLYVTTNTRKGSYLRTLVFQVSLWPALAIFFKSAYALV